MSLPATVDTLSVVALAQTIGAQNAQDFATAIVELARRYPTLNPQMLALMAAASPAPVAGAPAATAPTDATQVGGVDSGGLLRALAVDALGRLQSVGRTPGGLVVTMTPLAGLAAGTTIWTPAAGKKFRLLGGILTGAVAGVLVLGETGGTKFIRATVLAGAPVVLNLGPDGYLSVTVNNVLTYDTTGTAGTLVGTVWGAEE